MIDDGISSALPHSEIRRPKTAAERQRAYRQRKRQQRNSALAISLPDEMEEFKPNEQSVLSAVTSPLTSSVTVTHVKTVASPVTPDVTITPVTAAALPVKHDLTPVNFAIARPFLNGGQVAQSDRHTTNTPPVGSHGLTAAALALAAAGITMNGWFARTLGSTEMAAWLFLAIGVASDLAALSLPPAACRLWQRRQRVTAAMAWSVWLLTFGFAVIAGVGFASVNIADVTLTRASRVTPAVTIAQDALRDAVTARNRECTGGVGRFCREREQIVNDRQHALDAAMNLVEHAADPQTDAAAKIVAWLTAGTAKPSADGLAMLRLLLLALLPQIGGILLMISRAR